MEARRAALTPQGSGLAGRVLGHVTAAVTFKQADGAVKGEDPLAKLSRAEYYVKNGELLRAVRTVEVLYT